MFGATKTAAPGRAHIIVLGNAKGGSGKSTTGMHIIVALLSLGYRVAAIDLDGRQKTLGRYIENRRDFLAGNDLKLPQPELRVITPSQESAEADRQRDEYERFVGALGEFVPAHDYVVVDCPGADTYIARLGHSFAETLVTPINDSFVDLDLLARVDPNNYRVIGPSWYSEMVWEQRKRRVAVDGYNIDWVVVRNRLSHLDARNKRRVSGVLEQLARRIGFRLAPGVGERVVYREMFLKGLTLSDLKAEGTGFDMTISNVAARQEMRALIHALDLPGIEDYREAV
ncbi:division plane positioning ATPase MipZ [Oceanibacterium hippocampi]|uniref:ATPase MipZ n=1 Tax=Oceanibacterium hippocampi TaxID=745714 RepID=A0A1Y5SK17_9PROT|nr:division plane positioning ATPase MipZ [Oceanibacterium hippocampi]SLN41405.1 ATPase MipZ [Oceanibacterium hippocampi]